MKFYTLPSPASTSAAIGILRRHSGQERVVMILPPEVGDFSNDVRLRLLRREADTVGVQIGLVTDDADVRYFSGRAGIPVFSSSESAQGRWRYPSPPATLPPPSAIRPAILHPPARVGRDLSAPLIVSSHRETVLLGTTRRRPRRWWLSLFTYAILIAILFVVLGGLALMLVPRATVTLVPERSRFVSSLELTAQVGIDEADYLNTIIPARPVQARVEGFDTVDTTGSDEAPVGRATGMVTFLNQTNREIEVTTGTIVRTTTGNNVRFRVVETIPVPAGVGQQALAPVEAVEPGRSGNVPAFTISEVEGPLNLSLRVSNQAPTSGGTVEGVATVTQGDKDRVLGKLQEDLQRQVYSRLAGSLRQGEFIPPETVDTFVLGETYDRFAGEQSDTLGLQLQLLARGLAVDAASAEALVQRSLRESIPSDHFLLSETIRVGEINFTRFDDDRIDLTITASGEALIPIETANVRSLLTGVPLSQAATILSSRLQLAQPPQVILDPNWLDRLPYIPTRITVRVLEAIEG